MPFLKRTVEPQNLCRSNPELLESESGQSYCSGSDSHFCTSLNDVSCKSLRNILQQLSDLSRHACSIFLEIQSEAALVIHRSAALQRRLDTLQHTVRKLDHRRIQIRGKCWNRTYYDDEDELLPLYIHKPNNTQSKNGGSLRRRLLTSKIHQQQDRLWDARTSSMIDFGMPGPPALERTRIHHNSTFKPMQDDFTAVSSLDEESKWSVHYTAPWHQQENVFLPGSRPPCVEELHCQAKINLKTVLRECDKLRKDGFRSSQYYSQGPGFSSPLLSDGEAQLDQDEMEKKQKWSRILGCLPESCLYFCCHLKPCIKKVQSLLALGSNSSVSMSENSLSPETLSTISRKYECMCCVQSSETSAEEEKLVYSFRPQTPLLDDICEVNNYNSWSQCFPLPTPEEKMRQQAQSVSTDIVPINITGENFDRQASFRRTTINTDTIIRRSKRVKRRKTITGVPDNIKRELANNEPTGVKTQSIYMTDTLGHAESNSSLKHLVTRDSGCQTDDVKVVPPSMRRIRSQRGHNIAAQMANISLSSSGSISNTSDCTRQPNANDQGFHTLPRQGARICLQKLDANCSSFPYSGSTNSLPYQVTMQHASSDSQHMSDLTTGYIGFNHNSSTSSLNAGIVLQNARNHSSAHSSQSFDGAETPLHSMSASTSDYPFSSSGTSCSASSSCCQSPASVHTATETESQCSTLDGRTCSACEDSDMSESSIHSGSTLTTDIWAYKPASIDQCTSGCPSPTSNVCSGLEHSPKKTPMPDANSLFSVDTEGCYTSMPMMLDSKSYSHGCINKAGDTKHNFYECRDHHSHDDRASLHSNHSLNRSISLRKAKKPPLPPKRTDSLQRKPQRKHHNEKLLNEQLISSLHESLKSHSASFSGQMPFSGLEDSWVLGPRSHSSVSVASSGMSAPAAMCPTTPTHSDSSSQHSEYTESWDFHMDFPQSCSENGPSSQMMRPVFTKGNSRVSDSNGIPSPACIKIGINSKMAASPDKAQLITSPSSGYSSQSITPTAGTPVTSYLRAKSPAGRPKPKVPERKSSLRSSVNSYSTPLSLNTSDSVKSLSTPPPPPKTLPGLVTLQSNCTSPMPSFVTPSVSPITPLQSPLAINCTSEEKQSSHLVSSTIPEESKTSISFSPDSSSPTSDISPSPMLIENKWSAPPLPPPPPLPLSSSVHIQPLTPPLPGTGLQSVTFLKATNSPSSLDIRKNGKELNSTQSDKPGQHDRPVITAQVLQKIQLRPIKLMKLENIFTDIFTTVCGPENQEHNKKPKTTTDKPLETEIVKQDISPDTVGPPQNGVKTKDFSPKESTLTMLVSSVSPISNAHSSENPVLDTGCPSTTPACSSNLQSTITLCKSNGTLQDQRCAISPNRSSQAPIMPPILHQSAVNDLEYPEVTGSAVFLEQETQSSTSLADGVNQHEIPLQLEFEVVSDSQNSTPVTPRRHSVSSEISSDSLTDTQDIGLCDTDLGSNDKDLVLSDDKSITDDSLSSSSGSVIFKEEENYENDAVFDSGTDSSSPTFSSTGEDIEEMLTPARPRTTDDLFAAIHRSKKKVLGRCQSDEERSCSVSTSPPITPTSSSPSMSWMPRQNSYIQRKLRRSTTSNDSFKALLLKKGSRSEPGFRMSATEMLKCTDPRLQRSNADVSSPFSAQCTSPGRSRRASEEWACTEGALPRLSPSLTHSRYGRSSTPPCAASSRYNSRSRIPSGPMTAICEREGELNESIDCCNIPFPVSLSSSGTVCS